MLLFSVAVPAGCLAAPALQAYLYNPPVDQIVLKYPYDKPPMVISDKPTLVLTGRGFASGDGRVAYRLEAEGKKLFEGEAAIRLLNGWFETGIELKAKFPNAEGVAWEISAPGAATERGYAPLSWSRFHGSVKYLDGRRRPSYINMVPVTWGSPGQFTVPVADDGSFDIMVPARVYGVMNVNGTGYSYDALSAGPGTTISPGTVRTCSRSGAPSFTASTRSRSAAVRRPCSSCSVLRRSRASTGSMPTGTRSSAVTSGRRSARP
jgi:hypothetical protein